MLAPAMKYLVLRSLGAPAVLLSLAMQGIFRGFKDTRTPLYVIGSSNFYQTSYSKIASNLPLSLILFLHSLFWSLCSFGVHNKHHFGSNFDICLPLGSKGCSHCTCSLSVSNIIGHVFELLQSIIFIHNLLLLLPQVPNRVGPCLEIDAKS